MAREFKLPDIGEGVHEGEVTKWFVKEGDPIKENDPVVEVMTDKVTVQIPSPVTGTVLRLGAKEGEIVKVGSVLVVFGEKGEAAPPAAATPAAAVPAPPPTSAPPPPPPPAGGEVLAAPAVRRLAKEMAVDLSRIQGSGPGGRILEEDVRKTKRGPAAAPTPLSAVTTAPAGREERIPIRGLRKRIFDKMAKSKSTAAHFTYVDEVDMTQVVGLRDHLKEKADLKKVKLTFLPFVIKATIAALKQHPTLNASVDDERQEVVVKQYVNVGIATATDEGLTVAVIRDADRLSLWDLAKEVERLAAAARERRLTLEEVQGSTFTITSLGKEGGILATPIINWPEVAILGVHRIEKRPVVRDDHIVIREMMYLSCSFDHRVIDGHVGAAFVQSVKDYLEHPATLFVGVE